MSSSSTETEQDFVNEKEEKVKGRCCYSTPLASHEEVVENPTVFMDTLIRFHSLMGTRFMVPIIGGKELDLHTLYVEVTKRGGFQKVVKEKKWRDVGNVFRFAPTATSASYVLRKHYLSLLHQYEQVHFFKLQPHLFTPTVGIPVNESGSTSKVESSEPKVLSGHQFMQIVPEKKTNNASDKQTGVLPTYYPVFGTIDGKFDCGYLVSVKLGSEILRGVLYHPPEFDSSSSAVTETAIVPYNPSALLNCNSSTSSSRKRRRRRRFEDPTRPKPNRSGYNFFFSEKHSKLKTLYPHRERDFTKMIGESWTSLNAEERMVYQKIGLMDKERYKRELKEYKERLKLSQPTGTNS